MFRLNLIAIVLVMLASSIVSAQTIPHDQFRVEEPTNKYGWRSTSLEDELRATVEVHGDYGVYKVELLKPIFGYHVVEDENGDWVPERFLHSYHILGTETWTGNPSGDSAVTAPGKDIVAKGTAWGDARVAYGLYSELVVRVTYTPTLAGIPSGSDDSQPFDIQIDLNDDDNGTGPPTTGG